MAEDRLRCANAWLEKHGGARTVAGWFLPSARIYSVRSCNLSPRSSVLLASLFLSTLVCVYFAQRTLRSEEARLGRLSVGVPLVSQAGFADDLNRTDAYLLIAVKSAPANFNRRREVRRAYGWTTRQQSGESCSALVQGRMVCHYFVVGQTKRSTLERKLSEEIGFHRDVVRGAFEDKYSALTTKLLFVMDWALANYNFEYLLVGDDDTFINPRAVVRWLMSSHRLSRRLYAGAINPYTLVIRDPKHPLWGRWFVPPRIYSPKNYPPFIVGTGYIMSRDVVRDALILAVTERQKLFGIEDAFLGILMHLLKVKPRQAPRFVHCSLVNCTDEDPLVVGPLELPLLREFGSRLKNGEPICNDTQPLCGASPIYNYEKLITF